MNPTAPSGPPPAASPLAVLTLLVGGGQAILGGVLLALAAVAGPDPNTPDPQGLSKFFGQILVGVLLVVGRVLLTKGVLGVLAGRGLLRQRPWARPLTLFVAVLNLLAGLLWLWLASDEVLVAVFAGVEVLYAVLAFVLLAGSRS